MRFFYGLTALLVGAAIYMVVIQRDALLEFAGAATRPVPNPPRLRTKRPPRSPGPGKGRGGRR